MPMVRRKLDSSKELVSKPRFAIVLPKVDAQRGVNNASMLTVQAI